MSDWLEMEYLNAKGFLKWVEEQGVKLPVFPSNQMNGGDISDPRWLRCIHRWRKETDQINVYTADEFLIHVGLHLTLMPKHLYEDRTHSDNSKKKFPAELRHKILADDDPHTVVAKRYGVSPRTVANYRKEKVSA